jgi:type I restriction enzyme S subunit
MSELPKGWVEATFDDVAEIKLGKMLDKDKNKGQLRPYLRNVNVRWDDVALNDILEMRFTDDELEPFEIRDGDLLVCEGGEPGRCAVWQHGPTELKFQKALMRLRPRGGVEAALLAKALRLMARNGDLQRHFTGTTIKHLPQAALAAISVALPPLAEQKRIVAKLYALSTKSARARTELARIETLVSRYKQAVLTKAFSGELIGLAPAATEKPHTLCWDLPSGWRWVTFKEAVEIASNLVNPNTVPELPHIAPDNIESGTARLLPFKTIREDGVISAKHRFYAGQILYSKIRPYLRKAVIADFDGACSADMYPLSPRDVLSPRYLLEWLVGEQFTHFAIEHQGRTVLPKINQNALNQTPLPLPPLAAQHEIVRRIESSFVKIDRVAKEAGRALELLGRLDETTLAKAFRGELVLQDENDEPAELLLARIRAGRETALKGKKRVMKRTSATLTASDFLNAKIPNWPRDGISFQDLRGEFPGSYDDLKTAVFLLLSDENSPLQQVFDDTRSAMTLRKREK